MSTLDNLAVIKHGVKSKRVSSFDRSGGNGDCRGISAGETFEIANINGAGIIKHIWMTHTADPRDPMIRRNLILRMYWDGEENPSVECPLGDFFGQGFGEHYNYTCLAMSAAPQDGQALVCYLSMPFEKGARITLTYDVPKEEKEWPCVTFYFYFDYEEYETLPTEMGRLHAFWNREFTKCAWDIGENEWGSMSGEEYGKMLNPSDKENYLFADIEGKGQFIGVHYFVDNPQPMWYGEGDDMFKIDGEEWPFSLHGTGTEDYFNGAWCPAQIYNQGYFGYAKLPWQGFGWIGKTHCYRFHIQDPIYFDKSLRASIEHGHANCLQQDISSVAYWYQLEPHKAFRPIPGHKDRAVRQETTYADVTRWRDAWIREKKSMGLENPLWGNEPNPEKK